MRGAPNMRWGIRVVDGPAPGVGDELPPSRIWDDGEPTTELLNGTSAVGIWAPTEEAVKKALSEAGITERGGYSYYPGQTVLLVASETASYGEDIDEIVMQGARVVAVFQKENAQASWFAGASAAGAVAAAPRARRAAGVYPNAPPAAPAEGIRAFHGTPHNVDRFDISKIGTGEGEQAFGHGLYFASRKDVAAGYRNALSEKLVGGRPVGELNAPDLVRRQLRWIGEDGSPSSLGDAAQKVRGFASAYEQYARRMRGSALAAERAEHMAKAAMLREAADWMEKNADLPITRTGNVYEVRIRTSPERLLDWDKPFSQQPQAVQSALLSVMEKAKVAHYGGDREQAAISMQAFRKNLQEFDDTGAMVQEQIVSALGQQGASTALREAGIDGIQYLDGGSRSAGSGSYNYVVFNDELIEIVRKYGFVPVLVVGGKEIYPQQPSEGAPDGR
jgi:hypothetical protein